MKIIVDAMGGDHAPLEIIKGAAMAATEFDVDIVLVGHEETILEIMTKEGITTPRITIVDAKDQVTMEDNPATVLKEKPEASMHVALRLLGKGDGDALVSSGNTGALLTGGTLLVKRIRGIRRAALAPLIPTKTGKALLIDCGANVECTPEYLLQFAFMGSFYMEKFMGTKKPRVGLINNGTEEKKGTPLQQETYQLLKAAHATGKINFVGNVEGREVMLGAVDVIVCDGFTGNILLKTIEGLGLVLIGELKSIFLEGVSTKIAALLVKKGLGRLRKMMNYKETGGAPLMGMSRPIIKAHGSADAFTFRSAILQAKLFVESGINEEILNNVSFMTLQQKKDLTSE